MSAESSGASGRAKAVVRVHERIREIPRSRPRSDHRLRQPQLPHARRRHRADRREPHAGQPRSRLLDAAERLNQMLGRAPRGDQDASALPRVNDILTLSERSESKGCGRTDALLECADAGNPRSRPSLARSAWPRAVQSRIRADCGRVGEGVAWFVGSNARLGAQSGTCRDRSWLGEVPHANFRDPRRNVEFSQALNRSPILYRRDTDPKGAKERTRNERATISFKDKADEHPSPTRRSSPVLGTVPRAARRIASRKGGRRVCGEEPSRDFTRVRAFKNAHRNSTALRLASLAQGEAGRISDVRRIKWSVRACESRSPRSRAHPRDPALSPSRRPPAPEAPAPARARP